MNEEEKKTIEKFIEKCNKYDESVEIKGVSVGEEYRILTTVCKALNHIEKLQKENEELKNQEATQRKINELLVQRYSNSISLQKVKDKIEKYKNMLKTCNKAQDIDRIKAINQRVLGLQELLEEEK